MPILILIISESRSGFLLLIFELILSFIISIKRKKTKYILLPTLISIFVIALISGFNILMDSYTVSAMGIHEYSDIELMKNENKYEYNNHLKNEMNLIDSRVQNANNYINNLEDLDLSDSDRMRLDLMYLGVQQVKQNPLFGTGDLYYTYAVSETQIFEQTAHNIIIETLCCYGLIGFLQIFFILVMIIKNTIKSFKKSNQTILNSPICEIGIAIISYFTVSMVQPLGYDSLVFPILIITIIVMSQFLVKEERHVQQQK